MNARERAPLLHGQLVKKGVYAIAHATIFFFGFGSYPDRAWQMRHQGEARSISGTQARLTAGGIACSIRQLIVLWFACLNQQSSLSLLEYGR